jgi:starch synthase
MKVLYATSEAYPFAASGGLADVSGALPRALRNRMVGCRVIMPLYETVSAEMRADMRFITSISVPVSWRQQYCGIYEAKVGKVTYYLLDNEYYFKRSTLYGHFDDAERFAFFSRAVLEAVKVIDFEPDIIHCNDWQTALIPVYLRLFYQNEPKLCGKKSVFTIHNIQYQGRYALELLGDVFGLPSEAADLLWYGDCLNLMKGGIECAHAVSTVSPSYAREILDPWYSHELDGILRERQWKLRGIVNGIDTEVYNPADDKMLYAEYSVGDMAGKAVNKAELQKRMGLPVLPDVPLVGMVTRLVSHKGLDLVKARLEAILDFGVQMVVLGSGDAEYEQFLQEMSDRYPDRLRVANGFVPELAHKIYGAADIFLMPSKSEPCGLSQMVALRYGAIPVVRRTGGLGDTISDSGDGLGNGFVFDSYNADDMAHAVYRAVEGYRDTAGWAKLTERAMLCDNSWKASAGEYIKMYKELLK